MFPSVLDTVPEWAFLLLFSRSVMSDPTEACQGSLSFIISWSLLKLKSIELIVPSNHLILCCPLLLLPSIFPSIRVSSNKSALRIRWPKYWSFSIIPSKEIPGLISFRTDWLDLLAVQGTRDYYQKLYTAKMNRLEEIDRFLKIYNLQIPDHEEIKKKYEQTSYQY